MEDIQNATPLEVAAKNHSNTYHNLDHANVAVFSFSAGSIWQKQQDKEIYKDFLKSIWNDIKSPSWSFEEWWEQVGNKRFDNFKNKS